MKKIIRMSTAVIVAVLIGFVSGCEWETSSDDQFNTSQGAGSQFNLSGVYVAHVSGGELITGSTITSLQIAQTGDRLDIVDSNGRRYQGVTGSPGVIAAPVTDSTTGTSSYPAGALMSLLQVTFWYQGPSASIHDDVYFTGYIRFIAVTDIKGNTTQTDFSLNVPPVDINTSSTTEYEADESNSMMTLEGQWTEGEVISAVDGWSKNYVQTWAF